MTPIDGGGKSVYTLVVDMRLLVLTLLAVIRAAADETVATPSFPGCPACQEAQARYNIARTEYLIAKKAFEDAQKHKDDMKGAYNDALKTTEERMGDLDLARQDQDKVRRPWHLDNPAYVAAERRTFAADERYSGAKEAFEIADADYRKALQDFRGRSATADEKADIATEKANGVIQAVQKPESAVGPEDAESAKRQKEVSDAASAAETGRDMDHQEYADERDRRIGHNVDHFTKKEQAHDNEMYRMYEGAGCEEIGCSSVAYNSPRGGSREPAGGGAKPGEATKKPLDPETAKKRMDELLKKDSENAMALAARAAANSKLGNHEAACSDAKAALRGSPNDETASAIAKLDCDRIEPPKIASKPQGNPWEARGPGNSAGAVGLGQASAAGGRGPAATAPGGAATSAGAMEAALRAGDFQRAIALAQEALKLDPANRQALAVLAAGYKGLGDYKSALAAAEAGLKLSPRDPALLNIKANALNHLKDYKGALAAAEAALAVDPNDAAAHVNRAYALGGMGDKEGMIGALRRAAALDPQYQASLDAALKAVAAGDDLFAAFKPQDGESAARPAPRGEGRRRAMGLTLAGIGAAAALGLALALAPFFGGRREAESEAAPSQPAPAAAASPAVPAAGTDGLIAGKYELGRQLGEGGMGLVFEAHDRSLERRVAVKRMRPELKVRSEELQRFIKEARTVAHLAHPYIVGIHEIVEHESEVYMIFDYVDGRPLSALLSEKGRLPLAECQRLFKHVCEAIDCAHKTRILHRDLKPSNIMVDTHGYAKVMDFGVAREAKDTLARVTSLDPSGTPAYMAPEQHLGRAVQASDVYSLAVCLYEMLTGRLPFSGGELLEQKKAGQYPLASSLVPGLSQRVDPILDAALEPDPARRTPDAMEFLRALQDLRA